MKGRWLLIPAAVLIFIGGAALAIDFEWPERLVSMCRNVAEGKGAFFLFGAGCTLVVASAIWTTFRPKQSAAALVWSPLIALLGAIAAFAWWPASPSNPSVSAVAIAHIVEAVRASAAGGMGLVFASILSSFAAIAIARRARRTSAPSTDWRPIAILLGGIALSTIAMVVAVRLGGHRDAGVLAMPLFATILAAASIATVRDADAAESDRMLAAVYALGSILLAVVGTILSSIGGLELDGFGAVDPGQAARIGAEMMKESWRAGLAALVAIVPWIALVAVALRVRAPSLEKALRKVAVPIAPALFAGLACVLAARSALAKIPSATTAQAWPVLAPELSEDDECGEVQPSNVVWLSRDRLMLPGASAIKPPFDWNAVSSALDTHDPSGDVWLAVDVDDASFADLGGLIDALGRSRGPRGVGVTAGADDPFEGCAMRFVGKIGDGTLRCSEPIALGVEGCIPEIPDEKTWHVFVRSSDAVDLEWQQNGHLVTRVSTTLAKLPQAVDQEWRLQGSHRDPSDRRFDHAVVRVAPSVTLRDAIRAIAAVRAPRRDLSAYGGRMWRMGDPSYRPARKAAVFKISLGTIAP